jgi:hypothetical protein
MDWTLTGTLSGLAVLAGVVGCGSLVLMHSSLELTKEHPASAVLIPPHEPPVAAPSAPSVIYAPHIPSVVYAPHMQTERSGISNAPELTQNPSHIETGVPVKGNDSALSESMESRSVSPPPTGNYLSSAQIGAKSPPENSTKANRLHFPLLFGVGY